MTKLELFNSWQSAIRGLVLLGDQMKQNKDWYLYNEIELPKQDKKKIKTSLKFIKYIIKHI